MKYIFFFFLFFFIGIGSIYGLKRYQIAHMQTPIKNPLSNVVPFSLDHPPKDSLKGEITQKTGTVFWESRSATEEAKLGENVPVLQGEQFRTDTKSSAIILFKNTLQLTLKEETKVNIIQTLPTSFVLQQTMGSVIYTKPNKKTPLNIRVFHLLLSQKEGTMRVEIDPDTEKVIVTTVKGSAIAAYNDTDLVSAVIPIAEGKTFIFDDATRTSDIKDE